MAQWIIRTSLRWSSHGVDTPVAVLIPPPLQQQPHFGKLCYVQERKQLLRRERTLDTP